MARLSKEEQARFEGANWLLELVKKEGIEKAELELKWRGVNGIPCAVKKTDLDNFSARVKDHVLDTVCCLAAMTLRDEFEFGEQRINRFINRFNEKTDALTMEYCSWSDMQQVLKEEVNIDFTIPKECRVPETNSIGVNKE